MSTSNTDNAPTLDPARSADLDNGWEAVVVVCDDGGEGLWLLAPNNDGEPGCACRRCAPHEQLTADHLTR